MLNEYKQQSLRDLITKSRSSNNTSQIINKALYDIKKEITNNDKNIKVHAILKLIFLYLNNYDIKWANLSTMEIITTCGVKGKRVGYLMAQLQFKNNYDWILMLPNLIRKDLQCQNNTVISMSLDLVNNIMNPTFANEITKDLEKLLNLNNLLIRKKLVIGLTRAAEIFLKTKTNEYFWDDLLIKLVTILNTKKDKELSTGLAICIISCIQKICKNFPEKTMTAFMELMSYFTKCEINWNIIKLIDVFGDFLKVESRLAKKKEFIKLISDKLALTKSKSVEIQLVKLVITNYESTVTNQSNQIAVELFNNCEERLKNLLMFNDNNLILIALRILKELFKKNKIISSNYLTDVMKILENSSCKSIQAECLDIIYLCVDKNNYRMIVDKLYSVLNNLGNKAINTIIEICTFDSYSRLEKKEDFVWFLNILFELGKNEFIKNEINDFNSNSSDSDNSEEMKIAYILRDISQRIESLRDYILNKTLDLLTILYVKLNSNARKGNRLSEISLQNRDKKKVIDSKYSKNIQKIVSGNNSTNFFEENCCLKSPDSLITVLLFILGEYSMNELEEEKNLIQKIFSFALELGDNMLLYNDLKRTYFYSFLIFISKILTQGKLNNSALKEIKINDQTKSFEEFVKQIMKSLNRLISPEDLFDLELFGVLEILKKLFCLINEEKIEFFNDFINKKKLVPLHEKAQTMVILDKEHDINLCFPIDDQELNIISEKKKIKDIKKDTNIDPAGKQLISNLNNVPNEENLILKDSLNEKIVVDKNLYTPTN